jgi:hypothetical protein
MGRAAREASEFSESGEDPIDNYRHSLSGMYTTQSFRNMGMSPLEAIAAANALGIAHEASTLSKDERPWYIKGLESGEDILNNAVGTLISPLGNNLGRKVLQYLSLNNLMSDGVVMSDGRDMYFKDLEEKRYGGIEDPKFDFDAYTKGSSAVMKKLGEYHNTQGKLSKGDVYDEMVYNTGLDEDFAYSNLNRRKVNIPTDMYGMQEWLNKFAIDRGYDFVSNMPLQNTKTSPFNPNIEDYSLPEEYRDPRSFSRMGVNLLNMSEEDKKNIEKTRIRNSRDFQNGGKKYGGSFHKGGIFEGPHPMHHNQDFSQLGFDNVSPSQDAIDSRQYYGSGYTQKLGRQGDLGMRFKRFELDANQQEADTKPYGLEFDDIVVSANPRTNQKLDRQDQEAEALWNRGLQEGFRFRNAPNLGGGDLGSWISENKKFLNERKAYADFLGIDPSLLGTAEGYDAYKNAIANVKDSAWSGSLKQKRLTQGYDKYFRPSGFGVTWQADEEEQKELENRWRGVRKDPRTGEQIYNPILQPENVKTIASVTSQLPMYLTSGAGIGNAIRGVGGFKNALSKAGTLYNRGFNSTRLLNKATDPLINAAFSNSPRTLSALKSISRLPTIDNMSIAKAATLFPSYYNKYQKDPTRENLIGMSIGATGFLGAVKPIKSIIGSAYRYADDVVGASRSAGKLQLPKYQNVYRVESPQFNVASQADDFTGRWFGTNPKELQFYSGKTNVEFPHQGVKVMRTRMPDYKIKQQFGEGMSESAKMMSAGPGKYPVSQLDDILGPGASTRWKTGQFTAGDRAGIQTAPFLYNPTEGIVNPNVVNQMRNADIFGSPFTRSRAVTFPTSDYADAFLRLKSFPSQQSRGFGSYLPFSFKQQGGSITQSMFKRF